MAVWSASSSGPSRSRLSGSGSSRCFPPRPIAWAPRASAPSRRGIPRKRSVCSAGLWKSIPGTSRRRSAWAGWPSSAATSVSEWASPDGQGPLAGAERAAAEGRFQEALDTFLAAVQNGRDQEKQAAREAMLKVFAVLGEEDPLTQEYRRKLAAALF